jgi:hypothetical protein
MTQWSKSPSVWAFACSHDRNCFLNASCRSWSPTGSSTFTSGPDGSTKYNPEPDFKFVIITKFLSVENEFTLKEGLLLNSYFFLKWLGQSDEKAFGLDKSDVEVEHVPLIYHRGHDIELQRRAG